MEKINQSGQSDERSEWLSSGRSNHVWEWFAIKVIREMWKCQHDSGLWSEWLEKYECFDSELAFQDLTSRPKTIMKFWSRLINGSGLNTNTTLERRERRSGSAARPTSPPGSEPSRLSTSTSSPLPPSPLPVCHNHHCHHHHCHHYQIRHHHRSRSGGGAPQVGVQQPPWARMVTAPPLWSWSSALAAISGWALTWWSGSWWR